MTRVKKRVFLCLVACACVFIALALAVPRLIDHRAFKARVAAQLAGLLHADVRLEGIELDLLGQPRIALQGLVLDFHGGTTARMQSASIYPSLTSLLAGEFQPALLEIDSPEVMLRLSGRKPRASQAQADVSFADAQKQAVATLETALQSIPSCALELHNGALHIAAASGAEVRFQDIDIEASATRERLEITIACSSKLWRKLQLQADYGRQAQPAGPATAGSPYAATVSAALSDLDISACRGTIAAIAGASPLAESMFKFLHSGTISDVSCSVRLPLSDNPLAGGDIRFDGSLDNASIFVPAADLNLKNVTGRLSIAKGMIEATRLQARLDNSRIDLKALRLDAAAGFALVLLETAFDLDLQQLPGLLRFIPASDVRSELELIKSPSGNARGTCSIKKEGEAYRVEVAVESMHLAADYRSFPMPLELAKSSCRCRDGALSFNLSGRLGKNDLPDITAAFSLTGDNQTTINAQDAAIVLDELRSVLNAYPSTQELIKDIRRADGSLQVRSLTLQGPINHPLKWLFAVKAEARSAVVAYGESSERFELKSGSLNVNQNRLELSQAQTAFFDGSLEGGIALEGYLADITQATASAQGKLGQACLQKMFHAFSIPVSLMPRAPLAISGARVDWNRDGATAFTADFSCAGDARVGLALKASKKEFEISRLAITGGESRCQARLGISNNIFDISYAGNLTKATLDRILADNRFLQGWIKGDFTATFNEKIPFASSAKGTVTWDRLGYPGFGNFPVTVDSAAVTVQGSKILVDSGRITARGSSADLHGSIGLSAGGFILDLALTSDRIDVDELRSLAPQDNATEGVGHNEFWDTPLRGAVKVRARELIMAQATYGPCNFDSAFADKLITLTTADTKLCNIDVPGSLRFTPDTITLDVRPRADKSPLKEVLHCLTGEKSVISGSLDIEGNLKARAGPRQFLDSFAGNFSITARDGRIYKSNLFTRILSFLSIRNLLTGGIIDIAKNGFAYRSLHIKGDIRGRTIHVQEAALDSNALAMVCSGTIDMTTKDLRLDALATPFQMETQLLSKIPLVGSAFKKPVIGVPLYIGGTAEDPKISPRAPSEMGKDIMGLALGIIKLPIKIIEPVLPKGSTREK